MDLELSETQKDLQQLVKKFTKDEIIPRAAEYDKSMAFPKDILKKAWELGILTTYVPEKYGTEFVLIFKVARISGDF